MKIKKPKPFTYIKPPKKIKTKYRVIEKNS